MKKCKKLIALLCLVLAVSLASGCGMDQLLDVLGSFGPSQSPSFEETQSGDPVIKPMESSVESTPTFESESTPVNTAPHEHELVISKKHDATCTVDGYTESECECGYVSVTVTERAEGHRFGEWITESEPTDGKSGIYSRTCGECGYKLIRETAMGEKIEVRKGNGSYGYYDLSRCDNGEEMQRLYRDILAACEGFMDCTDDVKKEEGMYVIERIEVSDYTMSLEQMASVWKMFFQDNPLYYWMANEIWIRNDVLYLTVDEAYATYAYRKECDEAIETMTNEAMQLLNPSDSELEIALTLHDYLTERLEYARKEGSGEPETAIWAHNLIGSALYKKGVCEAYARAYYYLCSVSGLECLFVSGFANEPHTWNYVNIDNAWYSIDVTWDDQSSVHSQYKYFGMGKNRAFESHTPETPDEYGLKYLHLLPELSENSLQPVALYKGEMFMDTYGTPEKALEAMEEGASYTMVMYLDTTTVSAVELPKAEITFRGLNEMVSENTYYGESSLIFSNGAALNGNVILENINLVGSIDLRDHVLATTGVFCRISGSVKGNAEQCRIVRKTSIPTEITAEVEENIDITDNL